MPFLDFLLYLAILGVIWYMVRMIIPIKLYSYRAVVKDKKANYFPLGVDGYDGGLSNPSGPIYDYTLITMDNQTVKTTQNLYESIKVGETITVTFYSNGVRRLI